jgi:hypothetical protein
MIKFISFSILMFRDATARRAGGLDFSARGGEYKGTALPKPVRVQAGAKRPV